MLFGRWPGVHQARQANPRGIEQTDGGALSSKMGRTLKIEPRNRFNLIIKPEPLSIRIRNLNDIFTGRNSKTS